MLFSKWGIKKDKYSFNLLERNHLIVCKNKIHWWIYWCQKGKKYKSINCLCDRWNNLAMYKNLKVKDLINDYFTSAFNYYFDIL